jgi:hypothetical protein
LAAAGNERRIHGFFWAGARSEFEADDEGAAVSLPDEIR